MAALFKASFDGGSRGNPGPAAWGVAVFDSQGVYIEGHAGFLGKATNNVAEYHGLIQALRIAGDRNASRVEIQADSELIVRQLHGEYRVRNATLKPLFVEAMRRIRQFESFQISHVRREANREADRLVNAALDQAEVEPENDRIEIHETSPIGTGDN
jgi:ribonuclease HI